MRKVYNLLVLAVLFIAGTFAVQAQNASKRYTMIGWENSITADEVDENTQVVIEGSAAASGSTYDFISGLNKSTTLSDDNIYEFVIAGKNEEGYDLWMLKRVSTGEYLENKDGAVSYTTSQTRAWRFMIKDAETTTSEDLNSTENPPSDFSVLTLDQTGYSKVTFVGDGANISEKNGCTFFTTKGVGTAPAFSNSDFTYNAIAIFPVNDDNMVEFAAWEYVSAAFDELGISNGVSDLYVAGDQPGQVPEQYVTALTEAYNKADALVTSESTDADACQAAIAALRKAIQDCEDNFVYVHEGFYYFSSGRTENNGVYDAGGKIFWTWSNGSWCQEHGGEWTVPETMTIDDTKFVWKIIANEAEKGSYYMQNYYTKRYIGIAPNGNGAAVVTTKEPEEAYYIFPNGKRGDDVAWAIESATLKKNPYAGWGDKSVTVDALHCPADHEDLVMWQYRNNGNTGDPVEPSQWMFYNVNLDQLATLEGQIAQNMRNEALTAKLDSAQTSYTAGFTYSFDGNQDGHLDNNEDGTVKGLVTSISQITTNALETSEGSLDALLDNDISSGNFFHSIWSSDAATAAGFDNTQTYPYLQVDLGKAVKEISVKMWPRRNNNSLKTNNLPGNVNVYATNTPDNEDSWTEIGTYNNVLAYPYISTSSDGTESATSGNAVALLRTNFGETAYQYVRLEVTTRYGSSTDFKEASLSNANFNMGEIRVFESWYDADKSGNSAVPAGVLQEFLDAMDAAKTELATESATQETIDRLTAAYAAYLNELPDPALIRTDIAEAKAQLAGSEEGSEYGFFEEGSKAELQAKLEAVEAQVKDLMTKAEITALRAQVAEALAAFNSKIVLPTDGAVVYLISQTTEEANGAYLRSVGNGAGTNRWVNRNEDPDLDSRLDYMWRLHKVEGGYTLQSILNGEYLNAPKASGNGAGMSTQGDTCVFTIRTAKAAGCVNIQFAEKSFLNAQPNGKEGSTSGSVVTWLSASGTDNSAWSFQDANISDWDGSYAVDVVANGTYILTLPISVKATDGCYSVLGFNKEAKTIELSKLEGTIEAGTPFVFIEQKEETVAYFDATETDATALTYATEAKSVNGLQGTLAPVRNLHAGYGILYGTQGTIVDADGTDNVSSNRGYILPEVPATTETGDAHLAVDGTISAISNATINGEAAVVNVYTLTGVKVRSNVKADNAVKNLPAGLYIVGSKKVLVK